MNKSREIVVTQHCNVLKSRSRQVNTSSIFPEHSYTPCQTVLYLKAEKLLCTAKTTNLEIELKKGTYTP